MTASGFFVLLGFLLTLQGDVSEIRKNRLFAGIQRTIAAFCFAFAIYFSF